LLRDEGNDDISVVVRRQPWWAHTCRGGTGGRTGGQRRAQTGGEGEAPRGVCGLQGASVRVVPWEGARDLGRCGADAEGGRGTGAGDVAALVGSTPTVST
jgi:hypothetical protein